MKVSITVYSMNQYFRTGRIDVQGFIEYCAEQQVEGVDLGYFWKDEEKEVAQVPEWLEANGVVLSGYITRGDFVQKAEEDLARQVEAVKHALEVASKLGAPVLRIFAGTGYRGATFEDGLPGIVKSMRELVRVAEAKKVVLAVENHGTLCGGLAHIQAILKSVDSPWLKVCLDVGNFLSVDQDPVEATRILATSGSVAHVHMKDVKKAGDGRHVAVILGEGDVDLKGCVKELAAAGYDGWLSLEYEAAKDAKVGIPKSLETMKKILAEL